MGIEFAHVLLLLACVRIHCSLIGFEFQVQRERERQRKRETEGMNRRRPTSQRLSVWNEKCIHQKCIDKKALAALTLFHSLFACESGWKCKFSTSLTQWGKWMNKVLTKLNTHIYTPKKQRDRLLLADQSLSESERRSVSMHRMSFLPPFLPHCFSRERGRRANPMEGKKKRKEKKRKQREKHGRTETRKGIFFLLLSCSFFSLLSLSLLVTGLAAVPLSGRDA